MTQEEKNNLIPQVRYANAYVERWTDVLGVPDLTFISNDTRI